MLNSVQRFGRAVRDCIFPPFCFYCREYLFSVESSPHKSFLCNPCADLIKPIISEWIRLNSDYTMPVHAVSAYEDPLKVLILAKNYADYTASKQLAQLMWHLSALPQIPFDYLVPIPAHWTRVAQRGYNPAYVLAQEIAQLSGKPVLDCLKKARRTKRQTACRTSERAQNIADSFVLSDQFASIIEGKTIVVVDDLMTTGATLYNAGKELIQARPKAIYGVTACRVVREEKPK